MSTHNICFRKERSKMLMCITLLKCSYERHISRILFELEFYSPVNTVKVMSSRSLFPGQA